MSRGFRETRASEFYFEHGEEESENYEAVTDAAHSTTRALAEEDEAEQSTSHTPLE